MKEQEKERLLREREKKKRSRPKFNRNESWRYKRVKDGWRKPIGIDSAVRHQRRGWPKIVKIGHRGPKAVRGLTRAGMEDVLVHNVKEIEQLDPETQVARIASPVGAKKKIAMTNRADELDIKIINRPEEALAFTTISEISEELLEEEGELVDEIEDKQLRKKRRKKATRDLTEEELAKLAEIESELKGEKAKKKKPAKKQEAAPPKEIEVTYKDRTYTIEADITEDELKSKRGIPRKVKEEVAEKLGYEL
ncbi:MAG: 50S ribosomal protein L32e [Candidatus Heimdallarchaeota archaeon]|nr:50S ribosomal protein L32e [Candidatus Heimdallarchaeota archaeon]